MDIQTAPLPAAERARIAAAYGVAHVPETVTLVPRGRSAFTVETPTAAACWRLGGKWTRAAREKVAERRRRVAELAAGGLGPTAIAQRVNATVSTVGNDFHVLGRSARQSRRSTTKAPLSVIEARRNVVLEQRRKGYAWNEIAAAIGATRNTVESDRRALVRAGRL